MTPDRTAPNYVCGAYNPRDRDQRLGESAGEVAYARAIRSSQHRSPAGQRVLDATGDLKAAQELLGHASISTTGDVYADWDIDQRAEMGIVWEEVNRSPRPFGKILHIAI